MQPPPSVVLRTMTCPSLKQGGENKKKYKLGFGVAEVAGDFVLEQAISCDLAAADVVDDQVSLAVGGFFVDNNSDVGYSAA